MKIRNMARCALLTALLCVCAWIGFPLGDVSVTMQTFALFLTLGLLGGKSGSLVCLLYLLLGAVGLPVFSGFRGGLGTLLGATGGYILGFLGSALVYWLITGLLGQRFIVHLIASLLGLAVCYGFGTLWYALVWAKGGLALGLILGKCVLPYLLPDLIKLGLALVATEKLKRFILPSSGA
jgi:biotin transport system substrate-specific component